MNNDKKYLKELEEINSRIAKAIGSIQKLKLHPWETYKLSIGEIEKQFGENLKNYILFYVLGWSSSSLFEAMKDNLKNHTYSKKLMDNEAKHINNILSDCVELIQGIAMDEFIQQRALQDGIANDDDNDK